MLLNQIISSKNQRKQSEKTQSDQIINNIIKAIEGPKKPQVTTQQKDSLFDMFNENNLDDPDKFNRSSKLMEKILSGSKKYSNNISRRSTNAESKQKHKEISYSENQELREKIPKLTKKEPIKARPVTDDYIKKMAEIGDLTNLFTLSESQKANLAGALITGKDKTKVLEENSKNKEIHQKEEEQILKKFKKNDTKEKPPSKPLQKSSNTINKQPSSPPHAKTNNNIVNKTTNNGINKNNKPKSYDPLGPSNLKKEPNQTNKKQYNPLETAYNNKQKSIKRKREEYSDEEEDDLDGFIDYGDEEIGDNIDYHQAIRKIMKYDSKKYREREEEYDDDAAMEVGFDEIEKEEKFAAKIGMKEDEIEWKLIQKEKMKEESKKKRK